METLWLKFADEVLSSSRVSAAEKRALENVFSGDKNSPWSQALTLLGLKNPDPSAQMIKWHGDAPYFNWTILSLAISGGAIAPEKTFDGHYTFAPSYNPVLLWRLLRAQWTITKFMNVPHPDSIAESIALGLVMQSLMLRLGSNAAKLPQWLAAPNDTPGSYRKIVEDIQSIQIRRTDMSPVWSEIFANPGDNDETLGDAPDFFWDDIAHTTEKPTTQNNSKGLPVCAGKITGLAVFMTSRTDIPTLESLKREYNAPLILVFKHARPKTVEFFPAADALIFCEGGVLSHACTVAREMNIPCVTALGAEFFDTEISEKLWLTLDGAAGTVTKIR